MKFDDASKKLFTDGHVGSALLAAHSLPADLFPAEDTWNHFHTLSPAARSSLRSHSFGFLPSSSMAGVTSSTSTLYPNTSSARRHEFIQLNQSAIRYSPQHQLWSSFDAYATHQRTHFGCSLVVAQFALGDGVFSPPLLVVLGPSATNREGYPAFTRDAFELPADAPIPAPQGYSALPEHFSPTSFALTHAPREWLASTSLADPLLSCRALCSFVMLPDYAKLFGVVAAFDATSSLLSRLKSEKDILDWDNHAPAVVSSSSPAPLPAVYDVWRSGIIPPAPNDSSIWQPGVCY
jgi:hypothetical protein